MMNVMALSLVITSLAAAGVWSPNPDRPPVPHRGLPSDGVLREGHRLIVLEYERQVPQPQDHKPPGPSDQPSVVQKIREKAEEKASILPNVGQGLSTPAHHSQGGGEEEPGGGAEELTAPIHHAKEKISDAYDVGKEKIAELFDKSKETEARLEEGAKDAVTGAVDRATEVKDELAGNVSGIAETAIDKARNASEKFREVVCNNVKDMKDILRRGRDVVYDAAVYAGMPEIAGAGLAVAHLLGFAVAYGTCMWVTFVSSHVLTRAMPRQQFGLVQSKLYPVYFRIMAYSIGLALLAHFFGPGWKSLTEKIQGYNLMTSLVLVLANMLFLEPRATKVMFKSMKMEKEEGRGRDMADVGLDSAGATPTSILAAETPSTAEAAYGVTRTTIAAEANQEAVKSRVGNLNRRLKALNSYSSFLNVMTLMGLTWHLVHLARRLQTNC